MNQASLHTCATTLRSLYPIMMLLLLTTTTYAQLMRKDTATTPTNAKHWEVGLDLKPLWDKDEPYNFVVRYFFKEKWAIRGGVGFELNWSHDTLDILQLSFEGNPPRRDGFALYEKSNSKQLSLHTFLGVQYEPGNGKLRWYGVTEAFYFNHRYDYIKPLTERSRGIPDVPDFLRTVYVYRRQEGGGIRLINGFRYQPLRNLSISTELALAAQGLKYLNQVGIDDGRVINIDISKETIERGWRYTVDVKPLFRLFINYHFFKN